MAGAYEQQVDVSKEVFGNRLFGKLSYTGDQEGARPLVILNSGYGPSGSNSGTWREFMSQLSGKNANLAVLTWDYVGQGNSEGEMSELTPFRALSEMREIVVEVSKNAIVDPNRIGIYGSSFGGYVGLLYAGVYGGVRSMFLKSPASDYAEVRRITLGEERLGEWRRKGSIEVEPGVQSPFDFYAQSLSIDVYSKVAPLVKSQVKIVHGDADTNVPITQSRALNESLPISELDEFAGVNHGYKENDGLNRITQAAVAFFSGTL